MKVGIIGAGTMGSGIAQAFAQTEGYEVYLCDINEEFAANSSLMLQTVKTRLQKVFRDWLQKERKHRKMLMQS